MTDEIALRSAISDLEAVCDAGLTWWAATEPQIAASLAVVAVGMAKETSGAGQYRRFRFHRRARHLINGGNDGR